MCGKWTPLGEEQHKCSGNLCWIAEGTKACCWRKKSMALRGGDSFWCQEYCEKHASCLMKNHISLEVVQEKGNRSQWMVFERTHELLLTWHLLGHMSRSSSVENSQLSTASILLIQHTSYLVTYSYTCPICHTRGSKRSRWWPQCVVKAHLAFTHNRALFA